MDADSERSPAESRRDRFIRIAERRVNRILASLDSLGNCSNRRNYDFGKEDVLKMFGEIEKKLRETRQLFEIEVRDRARFTLR